MSFTTADAERLMAYLHIGKDEFLSSLENLFSFIPSELYFSFLEKNKDKTTEEFTLRIETKDELSMRPRRSFCIVHSDMDEIVFSLIHREQDWFDFIVGTPVKNGDKITNVRLLFSVTFWEMEGREEANSFYLTYPGFDETVNDKDSLMEIPKIKNRMKFQGELLEELGNIVAKTKRSRR